MITEGEGGTSESSQQPPLAPPATDDNDVAGEGEVEGEVVTTASTAAVNGGDDDSGPSRRSPSEMGDRLEFDDENDDGIGGGGSTSSYELTATSTSPTRMDQDRGWVEGEKGGDRQSPSIVGNDGGGIHDDDASEGDDDREGEDEDRMSTGFASFLLGDLVPYFFAPVSLFRSSSSISSGSSDIDDYIDRMHDLLPEDVGTKAERERNGSSGSRRSHESLVEMESPSVSRSSSSGGDDDDSSDPPPPFPFVNVRHRDLHHPSGDDDEDEGVVQSDLDDSSSSCDDEEDGAYASPALVVRLSELLNSAYGSCSNASEQTDRVLSLLDVYRGRHERDRLINLLEIKACSVRMMKGTTTTTTKMTMGTFTADCEGWRSDDDSDRGVEHGDPTFVRRVSELICYVYGPARETSNRDDEEGSRCCSTETSGCGFEFGSMAGAEVDRLAAVLRCYAGREPVLLHRLEARALRKASGAGAGAGAGAGEVAAAARRWSRRRHQEGSAMTKTDVVDDDEGRGGGDGGGPLQSVEGEMEETVSSSVPRRSLAEFFRERRRGRSGAAAAVIDKAVPSASADPPLTTTAPYTAMNVAPPDDPPDVCCSQSAATKPASNVSPRSIATEATTVVAGPWTEEWRVSSDPTTTEKNNSPVSVADGDFEQRAVPQAVGEPSPSGAKRFDDVESRAKRFDDMDAVGFGADDGPMGRWMSRPASSPSPPSSPASSSTDTSMSTVGSSGSASSDDDGVEAGVVDAERRRKMKDRGRMGRRMSAKAAAASGSVLKLLRGKSRGRSFTRRR